MTVKKIAFLILFSMVFITTAFAGKEDWSGDFTVKDASGNTNHIFHTPTEISYLFFHVSDCLELHKGTTINGVKIKEDVHLCTNSDIETFISEVEKLGTILDKKITLGKTYSN